MLVFHADHISGSMVNACAFHEVRFLQYDSTKLAQFAKVSICSNTESI